MSEDMSSTIYIDDLRKFNNLKNGDSVIIEGSLVKIHETKRYYYIIFVYAETGVLVNQQIYISKKVKLPDDKIDYFNTYRIEGIYRSLSKKIYQRNFEIKVKKITLIE